MVVLNNSNLYVEIAELGAEIRKVTFCGKDRFWNGDEKYWTGVSPVLFPICSGVPDDKFSFEGKEYPLGKHGFARKSLFTVENATKTSATFLLSDSPETLKCYPWHFELRVTYELVENNIEVTYDVKNTDANTMYYSIGAHEAYLCESGIEDYDVIFEKKETLDSCLLDGCLLTGEKIPIIKDSNVLPLYDKYFETDALVFKDVKSRFATLRNRKTGEEVSVKFEGFDYFLLWHAYGAPYMCIEPWAGICNSVGDSNDITKKEGIIKLASGENNLLKHTIYF